MIKKVLAGCIIIYALFMGFVVIKGGLKDQKNENSSVSSNTSASKPQTQPTTGTSSAAKKSYTLADVSKHAATSDCWIVISSGVYDVTNYVDQHPGGAREILRYCGKDATIGFNTKGGRGSHSNQAQAALADLLIGTIK